jgi:hypothetical protein
MSSGKGHKIVEICKKFSTKCGVFLIIWRFPFPDAPPQDVIVPLETNEEGAEDGH